MTMITFTDPDPIVDADPEPTGTPRQSVAKTTRLAPGTVSGPSGTSPARSGAPVPGAIGACVLRSTRPDQRAHASGVENPRRALAPPTSARPTRSRATALPPTRVSPSRSTSVGVRSRIEMDDPGSVDPSCPVNPKIARRRAEIRRSEHVFRRRRTLVALALAGSVICAGGVLVSPLLGVTSISIAGTDDAARIMKESDLTFGTPLVRISASRVEDRLRKLPDLAEVSVTKHWMRRLSIVVVARQPIAMVVGPTNTVLVAENDTAIAMIASTTIDSYDLPRLEGIAPASVGHQLHGDAALLARTAANLGPAARRATVGIRMDRGNVVLEIESAPGGSTASRVARSSEVAMSEASSARRSSGVANAGSSPSAISEGASPRKLRAAGKITSAVIVTFGKPVELDLKGRALEAMLANDSLVGYRTADLGVPDAPVLGR